MIYPLFSCDKDRR